MLFEVSTKKLHHFADRLTQLYNLCTTSEHYILIGGNAGESVTEDSLTSVQKTTHIDEVNESQLS